MIAETHSSWMDATEPVDPQSLLLETHCAIWNITAHFTHYPLSPYPYLQETIAEWKKRKTLHLLSDSEVQQELTVTSSN